MPDRPQIILKLQSIRDIKVGRVTIDLQAIGHIDFIDWDADGATGEAVTLLEEWRSDIETRHDIPKTEETPIKYGEDRLAVETLLSIDDLRPSHLSDRDADTHQSIGQYHTRTRHNNGHIQSFGCL